MARRRRADRREINPDAKYGDLVLANHDLHAEGVQRSHLRNRKAWLKRRSRAGQSWSQRKVASLTYCPAKARAS